MKRLALFVRGVVRRFLGSDCTMHAAGLTYFSLLALVPVLCCILVLAKACDVDRFAREQIDNRIDHFISNIEKGQDDLLAALAAPTDEALQKKRIAAEEFAVQSRKLADGLFARIDAFDVKTLGWIGFLLLLWTVISSLGMVEQSFNRIWHVPAPRPIWKRAVVYLFILVVLPVLGAVALSLPVLKAVKEAIVATAGATAVTRVVSGGVIALLDASAFRLAVTLAFAALAFAFFFWLMPNCRVRPRPALWGGLLTALLFAGWVKVCAIVQIGLASSSALYGSFALLPILLAWLYMSWQVVLFGACFVKELSEQNA